MSKLSFRVPDLSRAERQVPVIPRDDLSPAHGIALAMVGGVMLWAALGVWLWNAWGRP